LLGLREEKEGSVVGSDCVEGAENAMSALD
jgi:hypothetical protein